MKEDSSQSSLQISPEHKKQRLIIGGSSSSNDISINDIKMLRMERLNDKGQICPNLLTNDNGLIQKIKNHPGLQWKAHNVMKFNDKITLK